MSSLLLLAWFILFLIDGIHNGVQRAVTLLIGICSALLGGHAGGAWRKKRREGHLD